MRFNDKDAAFLAQRKGQIEGRLHYRAPPGTFRDAGFRERYFRLVNNLLFYFRFSEVGQIDFREPVGVIVLENFSVRVESDSELSFAFGIWFHDEMDKRHIFTARSEADVNQWVITLRQSSFQYWKEKLHSMRCNIQAIQEARNSNGPLTMDLDLLDLSEDTRQRRNRLETSSSPRHNPFMSSPKPPARSNSKSSVSSVQSLQAASTASGNSSFNTKYNDKNFQLVVPPRPSNSTSQPVVPPRPLNNASLHAGGSIQQKNEASVNTVRNTANTSSESSSNNDLIQW